MMKISRPKRGKEVSPDMSGRMRQPREHGKRRGWLLRFLLWATVLALPCWWLSTPWQSALAAAASAPFTLFGMRIEMLDFNVSAPFDLGLYLAMVFTSVRAPLARRRRALWLGVPSIITVEILTVVVAMGLVLASGSRPAFEVTMRIMPYLVETIPWVAAPTVWLVLLGPWELPEAALRMLRDQQAARR